VKTYVIYGQRKCRYPGEYSLEALDCMSEADIDGNPEYLEQKLAEYQAGGEFDRVAIVTLSAPEADIRAVLYPEQKAIPATVVDG